MTLAYLKKMRKTDCHPLHQNPAILRFLGRPQYVLIEDLQRHLSLHVALVKASVNHRHQIKIGHDENALPAQPPAGGPVHIAPIDKRAAEPELIAIVENQKTIDLGLRGRINPRRGYQLLRLSLQSRRRHGRRFAFGDN